MNRLEQLLISKAKLEAILITALAHSGETFRVDYDAETMFYYENRTHETAD